MILHICNYFSGSKVHRELFNHLQPIYPNFKVYTASYKGNKIDSSSCDYLISDYPYYKIDRINFFHKSRKIRESLLKNIDIDNINLIHAHTVFTDGYVAYKIYKKKGIPYIVSVRNTDINVFFRIYKKLGIKILSDASAIVCISVSFKNHLEKIIPEECNSILNKIICIPNGIEEFWLKQDYVQTEYSDNIRLITCANFNKNKNLDLILNVVDDMNKQGINTYLTICGEVSEKIEKKRIAGNDKIKYYGKVDKEFFYKRLCENDLFILLSKKETFGLVYAEALSTGTPIVYTKNQGFDGQFEEGIIGYHVDLSMKDINTDIICKIKKIKNNISYFSMNASRLSKNYNWNCIVQNFKSVYDQVINDEVKS